MMDKEGCVEFIDIFDKRIVKAVQGLCMCGHPVASPLEILTNKRDFICPKCGRDNSPPDYDCEE